MSRKKLFIHNIFAFGFINILNRIVPFLLLPFITRALPNISDFGTYNLFTLLVGFGTPLALLGLNDAMFRQFFDQDNQQYRYNVTATTQRIIFVTSSILAIVLILLSNQFSIIFFGTRAHRNIIILTGIGVFIGSNLNPLQAPTRMKNEKRVFVFSGFISSFVMYMLSLVLIYNGFSYLGLIYSSLITSLILVVFFWLRNKEYFLIGNFDWIIAKDLLKIGLPLVPTFLIYWIYDAMDKIMITNMIGTTEMGIYSIGSKFSQISQLIHAGFAGGWQYFAFSTMRDLDQIELNSKIFDYLSAILVLSFVFVYPFTPFIFRFFFEGDYVFGYIVAPYLFLSPLLLMLFQVVANQFLVIKKSYLVTLSLGLGALTNIILNYFLIKLMGIEGAAIATLVGYIITVITVMIVSSKKRCMLFRSRVLFILALVPVYLIFQRVYIVDIFTTQLLSSAFVVILICILYKKEISGFLSGFAKT